MSRKKDPPDPGAFAMEHFDVDLNERDNEVEDNPDTPPSAYVDLAVRGEPTGSAKAKRMARRDGEILD